MIDPLAEALIAARSGGPKLDLPQGTTVPRDRVLTVQSQVARQLGPVGAFKVACPRDAPVVMAPIFKRDIHTAPVRLHVPAGEAVGVELEYAFRLIASLPDPAMADFEQRLRSAVELLPVLEVVQSRLADPERADASVKMLDNQLNGGLVLGPPCRDWQHIDTTRAIGRLRLGDEVVLDGAAVVPGGGAFANLCALIRALGAHCGGLQIGQVVITGSLNGLPWRVPPFDADAQLDGLGRIDLALESDVA